MMLMEMLKMIVDDKDKNQTRNYRKVESVWRSRGVMMMMTMMTMMMMMMMMMTSQKGGVRVEGEGGGQSGVTESYTAQSVVISDPP